MHTNLPRELKDSIFRLAVFEDQLVFLLDKEMVKCILSALIIQ